MVVSQEVARGPGVRTALIAMATPLNLELLEQAGFDAGEAGPNDLVVALAADDADHLAAARTAVDTQLTQASAGGGSDGLADTGEAPRTLGSATRALGAGLALVTVPGQYAFTEAMDALRAGANVMVFSDGVPLEQEIALKAEARQRDRLVMGPDCGTAIVGGVGLGFANVMRPGPVGMVAASGTGAQQVCSLLDAAGVGVSHVLGVGGRDLSADVGGIATIQALEALDADPATEVIVLVSKPPDKAVAERIREAAEQCATPVVLGLVGPGQRDLTEVAEAALSTLGHDPQPPRTWTPNRTVGSGYEVLRGLFAGGTLCDESMAIAAERLGPIRSNVPLEDDWALDPHEPLHGIEGAGHAMVDYGEDDLTSGRPHPMIDNTIRIDRLDAEAGSGHRVVVLLDVVLGHVAHPNPASELGPAIAEARTAARDAGGQFAAIVSLIGTRDDPQDLTRQAAELVDAGASIYLSNAAATRAAVELLGETR
ncbi:FdrA family protein [Egibacter rhizosphaerae]|uniref:FdrA family protein n=2 Tax=Egibacter rhizosphaerae TaxID=1670831 RepID=A0A411YL36_9ACTN|nr:FdrA family protein [Egibacter rhizosphaerae]